MGNEDPIVVITKMYAGKKLIDSTQIRSYRKLLSYILKYKFDKSEIRFNRYNKNLFYFLD